MDKGDAGAARSVPWGLIHQLVAQAAAGPERLFQVRDTEADVVNPRTAPFNEATDGSVRAGGDEQFNGHVTEREGQDSGAVGGLGRARLHPQDIAVERRRRQVAYGDADMGDRGNGSGHGPSVSHE